MDELEQWKRGINLAEFAVHHCGYELDKKRSTKHSLCLRGPNDKIVIGEGADGHGIYYTIGDDKNAGSIVDFVMHRFGVTLGGARKVLRSKVGTGASVNKSTSTAAPIPRPPPTTRDQVKLLANWAAATPYEAEYLPRDRGLDRDVIAAFGVRQDARHNACMPHVDGEGQLTGWEIKNAAFTGFAAGGRKSLCIGRLDAVEPRRIVVTESAIDAMSYAQLRGERGDLYVSTGGSFSEWQRNQLAALLAKYAAAELVIATDADDAGRKAATDLAQLARAEGFSSVRDAPTGGAKDWNDALRARKPALAGAAAPASRPKGPR